MPALSDDEVFGGQPPPDQGAPPAAAAASLQALSDDEAFAPTATPPTPSVGGRVLHGAGVVASELNRGLEGLVTAPIDAATWLINKAYATAQGNAAPPGVSEAISGEPTPPPLISKPVGGSEWMRQNVDPYLSPTEPQGAGERALGYGARAVGALTGGGLLRAPLEAVDALSPLARTLLPEMTPANLALGAGAGVGGGEARETAQKMGAPPAVQTAADIVGATLGAYGTGFAGAAAKAVPEMIGPLTTSGRERLAGKVLGELTTLSPDAIEAQARAAPAGVQPTLGDVTSEQSVQSVQRAMAQKDLQLGGRLQQQASDNNQQILKGFDQVGNPGPQTPEQISQQAALQLEKIRAAEKTGASNAFKAVPADQTMVPTAPLMNAFVNYVGQIGPARLNFLPDTYQKLLQGYGPQESLQELQNFSSALKNEARAAASGANPDYNKANVLSGLHDALFPGGGPEDLLTPAQGPVGQALGNARQQWQQYKQTYSDPPALARVLRTDSGATPGSAALDQLLGPGAGQTERAEQFVTAAQGDPALLQSGRDWFTAKMRAAGALGGQDLEGDQMLSGNALRRFRDNNLPLINSPLFDASHRQGINDIVDAANMVSRTARAGTPGSDTYRNLTTGRSLEGLGLGPTARGIAEAAPGVGGMVGGGLLGYMMGGSGAAIGGGLGGGALGTRLTQAMFPYGRATEKVLGNIGEGLLDPSEAARLMRKAPPTPTTAPTALPGAQRSYLTFPAYTSLGRG